MKQVCVFLAILAASTSQAQAIEVSVEQQRVIEKSVRLKMKDPDSAKFDDIRASKPSATGSSTVCGLVNAKNSFGGYSGNRPFIGLLMTGNTESGKTIPFFTLTQVGSKDYEAAAVLQMCGQAGL